MSPSPIPLLIEHFVDRYNSELGCACPGFTPEAIEALANGSWRGSVLELENVVARALIFAYDREVDVADLASALGGESPETPFTWNLRGATRNFERQHILQALATCDNNKIDAARALGIGLSSLYRKLEELKILNLTATEGGFRRTHPTPVKAPLAEATIGG